MQKTLGAIIIFCLLTVFPMASYAAPPVPEGFVGVPWGATRQQVIQIMNERGASRYTRGATHDIPADKLIFRGSFDGVDCQLTFTMAGNSFVQGLADYCGRSPVFIAAEAKYQPVLRHLIDKYGLPQKTKDFGSSTYGIQKDWELEDAVTSDKYLIEAFLLREGVMFADGVAGVMEKYFSVTYKAVSLAERLKKSQL